MMVRSITFHLVEESRSCAHCKKPLSGEDGTLFILAPSMSLAVECCSWFCLYKFLIRFLKGKVADVALRKNDLLKKLGVTIKWGMTLTKEQLEAPVSDPIEDAPGEGT